MKMFVAVLITRIIIAMFNRNTNKETATPNTTNNVKDPAAFNLR
ncbi:MAG TPA: hypothetical protein VKH37_13895 [Ferruginibacter sp.]|nr:hypothetical protein [Ferruginibacter sp.]